MQSMIQQGNGTSQNWRNEYESIYYWNSNRAIFSIFWDKRFIVIKIITIMTDEQIKKNAFEYSLQNCCVYDDNGANDMDSIREAYLDGAQSRDEEIKELKERLKFADESIADADKWIAKYKLEIDKLSNPWISIKDRLPEEGDEIILKRDYVSSYFRKVRAEDIRFIEYSEPNAKWMLIPKIQKGE